MQLTKNFNKIEFESRDGSIMPENVLENIKELAVNLQKVRDILKEPIHINSGYRSEAYNAKVNGVKNSQHIVGKAADITMKHYTSKNLALIFEDLILTGVLKEGGLGLYNGFIHYDIRRNRTRWNYSTRYKDFYH